MSIDLDLAQNAAFQLARTLMVPISLFEVDGAYGVLPAEELDSDDVTVIFEYDPFSGGRPVH